MIGSSSRIVALSAALAAISGNAGAFRTASDVAEFGGDARVAWEDSAVSFRFSSSAWPEGLSLSTAEEALDLALNTWLLPECVNLVLRRAATSSHSIGPMDGVNSIAWVTNWAEKGFPSDAAGSTDVQYVSKDGDWKIEEADVYLNAENFNWPSSDRDLTAVLVHEIGHALGLMHPCEPHGELGVPICEEDEEFAESAMFPIYHDLQNELATDDIQGICYLYGTTSAQCGDCGLGLACIEGVCRAVCAK